MAARSRSKAGKARRSPKRSVRNGASLSAQAMVAHHEALSATLSQGRMEAFEAALQLEGGTQDDLFEGRIKALHDVVNASYALFGELLAQEELDPPVACHSGCIHCCYNQIALTEPEALVLGMHLLETRDEQGLLALETKICSMVETLKGNSWQEIGMQRHRLPCVFLEDGNCSVYPARPFACRGWNSVDENMCIQSNLSEDALTPIENHPIQRLLANSIQNGILRGSKSLGLEAGFLIISRAAFLLFDGGLEKGLMNCTSEWLQGKPFFGKKRDW